MKLQVFLFYQTNSAAIGVVDAAGEICATSYMIGS
jgi:hypothetical protein